MSEPTVDVLAVLKRSATQHWARGDNADAEDAEAALAAVAELIEKGENLRRAVEFLDQVAEAARRGEDTIRTGVFRDAREWIESAAREYVTALARVGGAE